MTNRTDSAHEIIILTRFASSKAFDCFFFLQMNATFNTSANGGINIVATVTEPAIKPTCLSPDNVDTGRIIVVCFKWMTEGFILLFNSSACDKCYVQEYTKDRLGGCNKFE